MAKTIYEGYRVGKNGGERWTGIILRENRTGQVISSGKQKIESGTHNVSIRTPKGGSAIGGSNPNHSDRKK